jgi:hypothetical protein
MRWDQPERPIPKHPYRDSVIVYAALAGVLVAIVVATGGDAVRGAIAAVAVFVASTAYSWWRWHEKLRAKSKEER